jgi:hypothetical protein
MNMMAKCLDARIHGSSHGHQCRQQQKVASAKPLHEVPPHVRK